MFKFIFGLNETGLMTRATLPAAKTLEIYRFPQFIVVKSDFY